MATVFIYLFIFVFLSLYRFGIEHYDTITGYK